jgi:hypothetical protein
MINKSTKLKENIRSHGKDKTLYGKQGDTVKIISDCGNVCIVEGEDGNRFPVHKDLLVKNAIKKKIEAVPDTTANHKPIIHRAPVSKKKAVPINQKSLF